MLDLEKILESVGPGMLRATTNSNEAYFRNLLHTLFKPPRGLDENDLVDDLLNYIDHQGQPEAFAGLVLPLLISAGEQGRCRAALVRAIGRIVNDSAPTLCWGFEPRRTDFSLVAAAPQPDLAIVASLGQVQALGASAFSASQDEQEQLDCLLLMLMGPVLVPAAHAALSAPRALSPFVRLAKDLVCLRWQFAGLYQPTEAMSFEAGTLAKYIQEPNDEHQIALATRVAARERSYDDGFTWAEGLIQGVVAEWIRKADAIPVTHRVNVLCHLLKQTGHNTTISEPDGFFTWSATSFVAEHLMQVAFSERGPVRDFLEPENFSAMELSVLRALASQRNLDVPALRAMGIAHLQSTLSTEINDGALALRIAGHWSGPKAKSALAGDLVRWPVWKWLHMSIALGRFDGTRANRTCQTLTWLHSELPASVWQAICQSLLRDHYGLQWLTKPGCPAWPKEIPPIL